MASARVFLVLALVALVMVANQPQVQAVRELRGVQDKFIANCKTYGEWGAVALPSTPASAAPEVVI